MKQAYSNFAASMWVCRHLRGRASRWPIEAPLAFLSLVAFSLCLLLPGCSGGGGGEVFKPDVTGRNGEVLVVLSDALKADSAGRALQAVLQDVYLGLPTDEPCFEMHTVPPAYFDRNMHLFRNIVQMSVADTVRCDTIQYYKDVWARGQAVVSVRARSSSALPALIARHQIRLMSFLTAAERDRLIAYYTRIRSASISAELQSRFGVDMSVPNSFQKGTPEHPEQLAWWLSDTKEFQDALMVYTLPYRGVASLDKLALLNHRDSLLRANIGGPQGSMMCTEVREGLDKIIYKYGAYRGLPVAELRGLWRLDGFPMGGPFIMRALADTARNRLIVADGYVYYPSREHKRNHIRQLEAIMHTLQLTQ